MELASIAAVCNSAVSPKLYKFIFCPSVFLFLSVFWYADCFSTFLCVITELCVSVTTVYLQWHSGYLVLTLRDRFLCKLLWGRRRLQNYIKITYQFCGWGLTFINLPVLQGPASVQAAAWAVTHSHVNKSFYSNTFSPSLTTWSGFSASCKAGKGLLSCKINCKILRAWFVGSAEYWLDNIQTCGNNLNWFWIKNNWNRDPYCLEKYEP